MIKEVNKYINERGIVGYDGNVGQIIEQQSKLKEILDQSNPKKILEIGFNAGHSSELFLSNTSATVLSFEIKKNDCVKAIHNHLNKLYDNRHSIIYGDSKETIPQYIYENPDERFDLIFIDGGHELITAQTDLLNCMSLSHESTVVIMDDYCPGNVDASWCFGPTWAWKEAISNKMVNELGNKVFLKQITKFNPFKEDTAYTEIKCIGRGMAWGLYNLD